MSSKNTGKPTIAGDPYETPEWCVDQCIYHALPDFLGSFEPKTILEPSAGSGVFVRLLRRRYPNAVIHGIDLDPKVGPWPEADLSVHGNFLSAEFGQGFGLLPRYDLVIGNPPYTFALPFVKQGSVIGRQVTFLLRAGFLESEERNHYLRDVNPPAWEHVLANRPAFVTTKTDSCVYMWISWGPVFGPEVVTRSRVLPSVPKELRRKVKQDRTLYMEKLFA